LKEPGYRNSKTNKTALAINIFFTSGITDKFERNMDRFNNKRDIAHEKKFNMNVMLYDDIRTGLCDLQVNTGWT
jgi:hypothetical protein